MSSSTRDAAKDTPGDNATSLSPRLVMVEPSRLPYPTVADLPTVGEIGRQVLALRGWRRALERLAGLSGDQGHGR